jgi:hypothetical protein
MQHAKRAERARFANHRARVILGVTRMDDEWFRSLRRQPDLGAKRGDLGVAGRIVVVVVEATFTDGHRSVPQKPTEALEIARWLERRGVVRMYAGRREYEARVIVGDGCSGGRGLKRLANADNRDRARVAGAGNYLVAVAGERRVREVGVAVDED